MLSGDCGSACLRVAVPAEAPKHMRGRTRRRGAGGCGEDTERCGVSRWCEGALLITHASLATELAQPAWSKPSNSRWYPSTVTATTPEIATATTIAEPSVFVKRPPNSSTAKTMPPSGVLNAPEMPAAPAAHALGMALGCRRDLQNGCGSDLWE